MKQTDDRRRRRRLLIGGPWAVVAGAIAVGALVAYLMWRFPGAAGESGTLDLVRLLAILALVGSAVVHWRMPLGYALKSVLVWVAIAAVALLIYSYRHELSGVAGRLGGELVPSSGTVRGETVAFKAGIDGHFHVDALVDGRPVRFMVDTGASRVVLSPADAERLGLDPARLDYTQRFLTANGTVFGAPVRLSSIRVGPIIVEDVRASVNAAAMDESLLGMSFLSRLSGYSVQNGTLILAP